MRYTGEPVTENLTHDTQSLLDLDWHSWFSFHSQILLSIKCNKTGADRMFRLFWILMGLLSVQVLGCGCFGLWYDVIIVLSINSCLLFFKYTLTYRIFIVGIKNVRLKCLAAPSRRAKNGTQVRFSCNKSRLSEFVKKIKLNPASVVLMTKLNTSIFLVKYLYFLQAMAISKKLFIYLKTHAAHSNYDWHEYK